MVTNRIIFFATSVQPNPEEIDYWVDLSDNPYGGSIKYFNGTEWVRLAASGGMPDLSNYYTKTQVNKLLNDKANISDVDSKVDDEEVKDVIKDIQFNTSNPNGITMVMFKYDGSDDSISLPIASTGSAGIVTSKDFLDFVKQHQLQELHTEMIDTFADIRAKYQKKLIAGLNIEIDQETNVISASGDLAVQWDNITNKPDFKPVSTSGDYNDLINKLKPGKDVSISEDNVINIAIDSDSLNQSLATLQSNIDKEAATARAAETKLGNDIATEKNRAQSAEQTISTNLQNEINRSTQVDTQHTNAIKQAKSYTDTTVTAEQTRAEAAEQKLTSDLASEVTRAKGAESANTTAITNEVERATGVEEALRTDVEDLTGQVLVLEKTKVNKVEGKGLSTNDYTTPEKNKLAAIEAEANKYVLPAATASALGGVKIGSNITLADGGTISITKANVTSALGVDPTTTYVKKTGDTMTGALTNSSTISGSKLISTVAAGTAPIQVASTTLCTNLNADMVDGFNVSDGENTGIHYTKYYPKGDNSVRWIKLATLPLKSDEISSGKYIMFEIVGGGDYGSYQYCYSTLIASTRSREYVKLVKQQSSIYNGGDQFVAGYVVTSANVEIWLGQNTSYSTSLCITCKNKNLATNVLTASPVNTQPQNFVLGEIVTLDAPDWYGVSWSETSSNPDCTRIGNMDMHRSLPIQSMMKPFAFQTQPVHKDQFVPLKENFTKAMYGHVNNGEAEQVASTVNVMIKIPEFWYVDDYTPGTKTHNLKICPHAKPGWYHHKEAYVSAYEAFNFGNAGRLVSMKSVVPTINFNRTNGRTWARANGFDGEAKWNLYTYEEHRAICHLFLVEYATRNSQKAVNTALTPDGFRQGGLGSGCTTRTATINGATTWSFIPTGSSDSLGSGSGEVTVTIQQTDSSGSNTSTITRKCNRYRGIENPFGHIWKHTDDVISVYSNSCRTWYKSVKPDQFATNKNNSYKPLCSVDNVNTGYKTEIKATPACDFFSMSVSGGSETTYWCDYNWDNTNTSEHCLLIGGRSDYSGQAGLFTLSSDTGVGASSANIGSRLTYLPWAE